MELMNVSCMGCCSKMPPKLFSAWSVGEFGGCCPALLLRLALITALLSLARRPCLGVITGPGERAHQIIYAVVADGR